MNEELQSIESVKACLEVSQKGKVVNSAGNYRLVLQNDPLLRGAFRLNLLTDRIDIVKPLGWFRDGEHLTDVDLKYLLLYFEEHYGLYIEKKIDDAIKVVANENRYHPIRDYLNALEWDGTERLRYALHHFLGADISDYTHEVLRLMMLGAIARAFQPGTKFEVMLCLVGGQGAGKSTFVRFLAISDDWFTDDIKRLDDENVYRKLQGHWIAEFPEMVALLNTKTVEETKAFMSRQQDTYKRPYEVHPKDHKRQCVFFGSSNTMDFLPLDRSGNRRFLPVMCHCGAAEVHVLEDEKASRAYIDQMWAEAMVLYRSGEYKLRLSTETEKYLKEHQKEFMQEDSKVGLIQDYLERYKGDMVCSRQLYAEALGGQNSPMQWELREINDIMNHCVEDWVAFSNPRHFPEPYRRQRGWERIEKPDNKEEDFVPVDEVRAEQMSIPKEWME